MIKSFRRLVQDGEIVGASNVFLFKTVDELAVRVAAFLCEGGRTYDLGKGYHCRFDRAHVPGQQDHLHVYLKSNQACVINRDGTPSHSTTVDLPGHVRDKVKTLGLVTLDEDTEYLLHPWLAQDVGAEVLRGLIEAAETLSAMPEPPAA